jgi:MFS family permease
MPDRPASSAPTSRSPYGRNIRRYQIFYAVYDFQLWWPIWILYLLNDRGMSFSDITLIGIPYWLIIAFGQVPAGVFADRFGRAWSMRIGSLIFAAAMIVFGLSGSLGEVIVAWVLWAIAMTLVAGADSALLHDSLKAVGRAGEFEKYAGRTFAIRSSAIVVATLLGGPIASAIDIRVPIFLGAAASLIAAGVAFTFTEPPRDAGRSAPSMSARQTLATAARTAWNIPSVRYLIPFVAILLAGAMPSEYLLQPFLISHDVSLGFEFSALQVPIRLVAVFGAATAFWWIGRMGEGRTLSFLPFALVVAYAGLGLVDHLGAIGFLALIGLARAAAMPVVEGYINRRVPSSQRATILSLNHMGFSLLVVPLLPLLGFGVDDIGIQTTFGIAAVVIAVSAVIVGSLWLRAHRRDPTTRQRLAAAVSGGPTVLGRQQAVGVVARSHPQKKGDPLPDGSPAA